MSLFPKNKGNVDYEDDETTPLFPRMGRGGVGIHSPLDDSGVYYGAAAGDGGAVRELFDRTASRKSLTPGELEILMGKPQVVAKRAENELADLINALFVEAHHYSHAHPRSNPQLPPVKRFKRHRNFYVYELNQFRHWWKTSRLLVRLSGGLVYCQDPLQWTAMSIWHVSKDGKQAKHALKQMKSIGKGGAARLFLQEVHPFTRTIRIILAVARAWEARVDNRLYEVGIAEALYVCAVSRFWAVIVVMIFD